MKPNKLYKYATEAGLNFVFDRFAMLQRDEFKKWEKSPDHLPYLRECNIYFICQRNRVGYKPNSMQIIGDDILMYFEFWEGVERYPFPISHPNGHKTKNLSVVSDPPYSYFKLNTDKGETIYEAKSTYFVDDWKHGLVPPPKFLDFEVLYIGQAMDNSDKPTFNRLIKHEKLEEIYSVTNPDKEIFLFLFPLFDIRGTIEIRNSIETKPEFTEEDKKRLQSFMDTKLILTHEQQVAVAEAALIRYFDPKYNDHHTKTFPTKRNTSYDELYKMDLNAVSFELDLTAQNLLFYSPKVKTNSLHSETFFLRTESDRRKLFDL